MSKNLLIAMICVAGLTAAPAMAEQFEVHMLNKGVKGGMVFEPDLVKAMPGDTIKFVSVDKGHNVEGIKGMLPEGVAPFKSKLSQEYVLSVKQEGVYGVKCTPHYGLGMVAVIAVGKPVNAEAAKTVKQHGKAKQRFDEIFAALK